MNKFLKTWLPLLVLLLGTMAAFTQLWALSTMDDKGLLIRGHISQILSWILTAGTLGLLFYMTWPMVEGSKFSFNFPADIPGAVGSGLGAVGIVLTVSPLLALNSGGLTLIAAFLSVPAAALLLFSAAERFQGRKSSILPHSVVCIWFLLLLICQYQQWSAEPQLQLYAFQLLATVFLMVSAFQRACFHAGMGQRRSYAFFRLSAGYFCLAAIPGSTYWILYLGCALWCLTDLCNLTPMPSKGR